MVWCVFKIFLNSLSIFIGKSITFLLIEDSHISSNWRLETEYKEVQESGTEIEAAWCRLPKSEREVTCDNLEWAGISLWGR